MRRPTRAPARCRRVRSLASAWAVLPALAAAAACTVQLGGAAPPPSPGPLAEAALRAQPPMCVVDDVASSVGTLRCFYRQLRICDRTGAWRAPSSQEFTALAPGPCAEPQPVAPPRARPAAAAARAR